jgi:hypothetical protein
MTSPVSSPAEPLLNSGTVFTDGKQFEKTAPIGDPSVDMNNARPASGPFACADANLLYLACRRSGDSPEEAFFAVERSGDY